MPVTIYPTNLKYKNSNGQFQSATAIKGDSGAGIVEQVNGTAPTIVCEDNHRYICGEVLSLNITPPANGVCEIIFESGSTATLLTAPNTIKWPEWFNPNSLETSATYQFKISNGLTNVAIWPNEGLTGDTRVRIQKMLGVYEAPWELIREDTFTNETEADYTINSDANGQAFELTDALLFISIPAQPQTVVIGKYGSVHFCAGSLIQITAYLGAQSYNATSQKCAIAKMTQDAGLLIMEYSSYTNHNANGAISWHMNSGVSTGAPFRLMSTTIDNIVIKSVSGTMNYRLYGKRK